ncbi:MAG: DNA polymerase IV [Burkholderiales bacterium]|nr:DNA polymerase IV [Burkholderiales bacterium]
MPDPLPGAAPRRIAHLDMDAFYASVELLRRPELRGLPVVIGGRRAGPDGAPRPLSEYAGRGVVTTCTYEARAYGVHSAMAMMKARALCPQALMLPADFDEYRRLSRLFKAAIAAIAPEIEDRGIDEVYIDLTQVAGESRSLGQALKRAVREATGLTCSIAIAPNKLLAKIGSELDKPDGLTLIEPEDLEEVIWPLPARRINGIGPKAGERLAKLDIVTIGDLARERPEFLVRHFGERYGRWLHACAWGRDDRPVVTHQEPVSRSRETTFEEDTRDWDEIAAVLSRLCRQVGEDLQRRGYAGRTIGVKLRYDNFRIVTRDNTVAEAVNDPAAIRRAAFAALARVAPQRRLARPIRLIGVRVGALVRPGSAIAPSGPAPGETLRLF